MLYVLSCPDFYPVSIPNAPLLIMKFLYLNRWFLFLSSFSRIKTPVKGHSCKHLQVSNPCLSKNCFIAFTRTLEFGKFTLLSLPFPSPCQCFDFNNYVGMNSRRPLWRCPHCSQSVCFTDIRIDQSMVKASKDPYNSVYLGVVCFLRDLKSEV